MSPETTKNRHRFLTCWSVALLLTHVCSPANAQDTARIARLEQQILLTREVLSESTNKEEFVEWNTQLDLLKRDLETERDLKELAELEEVLVNKCAGESSLCV